MFICYYMHFILFVKPCYDKLVKNFSGFSLFFVRALFQTADAHRLPGVFREMCAKKRRRYNPTSLL